MVQKSPGRRIENFSSADVIAHGREARRKRRPIWTNPFTRERADLWRKGWHRPHDPVGETDLPGESLHEKKESGGTRKPVA